MAKPLDDSMQRWAETPRKAENTPLPWFSEGNVVFSERVEVDEDDPIVCDCVADVLAVAFADAEFVMRACNAHDALLAACEAVLQWDVLASPLDGACGLPLELERQLRAAIAAAKSI